ncbi:MAG: hypothetical protein A2W90_02575 [Bacteroidetes bacterium GWF2_42_66]|nr:MAG: hypothetical protein A2W92_19625 [Bacteroidetes bacterium GWA2_42_15]OFY01236.1 MAG: hypothetical protein A2W89_16060 [Bacteroidetes bacterium GWE2_42_39]OFY42079.1 MAG: hypothetical protein A2W90_02575 [Bacteroidetes bacterium GWF2_42_66]HBL77718.1 hypothetical protein [Prolixibacteraceae bacterium]HCB62847.1 hypothetical protein [Bacteroidales bacterium]
MQRIDQRKLIIESYRIGSKPLIETSRRLLKSKMKTKSRRGNLEKSIGFVPLRSSKNSVFAAAKVGARRFGQYRGFHGHLYDAGTTSRTTKKGFSRGSMPATHFFTAALAQTETQLINDSQDNMLAALDKQIQRNLKKQNK